MASKQDIQRFVEITRYDEETNTAYGYATTEALDSYGTVIDLESVKRCLPDYMQFANIREMHSLLAAGTTEEATIDDTGLYIAAKVVDPVAQLKCKEGVYKGFSIGAKKDYQIDNRIFLKSITEISLVDRPSNTECTIDQYRVFGKENEMDEETVVVEPAADVKRDMYDVNSLASVVSSLASIANYAQYESDREGDGSPVPAVVEIVALADGDDDVQRKGAELSKKNLERVQAMHDHAADMGACCRVGECNKAASGDDVVRSASDITRLEELESDVTRLQSEVDTLRGENEALKAEPAPAKGVTRVIEKTDDTERVETPAAVEPTDDPTEAIRRIHQSGGVTITRI